MSNLLSDSSESFLSQPWGLALFIIIDIAVLVLILALNYKWCCKRILDILFSFLGLAVLFPFFFVFWIVQFVYNKKTKAYPSLFVKRYFIGKKEKFSYKTEFACEDADGSVTGLGKVVRACKIAYYPYLADIFCGRLSFIGPVPMRAADSLAVKGEARVRFSVRAGLLSSLEKYGGEALTYADMFEEDAEYVSSRSLFKDFSYFFLYLIAKIRGDRKNRLGECAQKTYVRSLSDAGEITEEEARDLEKRGEEKLRQTLSFREEKAKYQR